MKYLLLLLSFLTVSYGQVISSGIPPSGRGLYPTIRATWTDPTPAPDSINVQWSVDGQVTWSTAVVGAGVELYDILYLPWNTTTWVRVYAWDGGVSSLVSPPVSLLSDKRATELGAHLFSNATGSYFKRQSTTVMGGTPDTGGGSNVVDAFTLNVWCRFETGSDAVHTKIFQYYRNNSDTRIMLAKESTASGNPNTITLQCYNASGTKVIDINTTNTITADGNWHSIFVAVDLDTQGATYPTGRRVMAIDGVAETIIETTWVVNDFIHLSSDTTYTNDYYLGASNVSTVSDVSIAGFCLR